MRVQITKPFEVDSANGPTRYEPGQIVGNGQRNWVDKELAIEASEDAPKDKPDTKSAEPPKG